MFVYPHLPLVLFIVYKENLIALTQSRAVQTLRRKGVSDIATELATRGLPLAGRVNHFLSNWEVITQDEWV